MSRELVVVVEDEADILTCIRYQLCSAGYRVASARTAAEGLETVRSESPHLVLLDRLLPDRDGIEILRELRTAQATKELPIVMLSAKTDDKTTWDGWRAGANYYMAKPFEPEELVRVLRTAIG